MVVAEVLKPVNIDLWVNWVPKTGARTHSTQLRADFLQGGSYLIERAGCWLSDSNQWIEQRVQKTSSDVLGPMNADLVYRHRPEGLIAKLLRNKLRFKAQN